MSERLPQRTIRPGVERLPPRQDAPRHQHRQAYVTAVFDGAYDQAAYAGRLAVGPGDLVLQPTFDCHADRMRSAGVALLRLPWRREAGLGGVFSDCPLDDIRALARKDLEEAVAFVAQVLAARTPRPRRLAELSDLLAADLAKDQSLRIGDWAHQHGRSREALSRAFRTRFGVGPDRFRFELRARAAWGEIVDSTVPLSLVAQDTGFADQAHMTRSVGWLTGAPPLAWRGRGARAALAA